MKRIFTGLILGLFALIFVFYTNDAFFKIGLFSILVFSLYELFKIKAKRSTKTQVRIKIKVKIKR